MKLFFLSILVIGLSSPMPSFAQWWNPFGPSTYEDCILEGMKTARTRDAVRAVQYACLEKFPPKERSKREIEAESNQYEAIRKKCKIPKNSDGTELVGITAKRPRVIEAVNKLTSLKLDTPTYGEPRLSFQNRNDFNVTAVAIGFTKKKQCPQESDSTDYEAKIICKDTSYVPRGVGGGVYGSLTCQNEAKKFQMGYCAVAIRVERPLSRDELVQVMDQYGLCD
jgi:hypothetical protein